MKNSKDVNNTNLLINIVKANIKKNKNIKREPIIIQQKPFGVQEIEILQNRLIGNLRKSY